MKLYLGENMRKLRLAKDLTQEALAEELGVSPQTISRWEGGSSYPEEAASVQGGYHGGKPEEGRDVRVHPRQESRRGAESLSCLRFCDRDQK